MKMIFMFFISTMVLPPAIGQEASVTISSPTIESRVCAREGPLSREGSDCKIVDLDQDSRSATGYAIPVDLRMAFHAMNRLVTDDFARMLRDLDKEDVDSKSCLDNASCAGWVTVDLAKLLRDAWGIEHCSLLARDLIRHGVNPTQGVTDGILLAYKDMVIAPQADGPFTRYLRTEETKPSMDMVYKFLIDRGYSVKLSPVACKISGR